MFTDTLLFRAVCLFFPFSSSQEAFSPDRWCVLTFAQNNDRLLTLFLYAAFCVDTTAVINSL